MIDYSGLYIYTVLSSWDFSLFCLWKFTLGLQKLSNYKTLAGVSRALAHRDTCHFLIKNLYYNSPKLTEHPILHTPTVKMKCPLACIYYTMQTKYTPVH